MTRRSAIWLAIAAVFAAVNAAGAVFAALAHEPLHCAVHILLALLGAYVAWRIVPRRIQAASAEPADELSDRLRQIEQSMDAVAIEVERIGEGQRFMTKVMTETERARPEDAQPVPAPPGGGPRGRPD